MNLSERAILVGLKISLPTLTRRDKTATSDVEFKYASKEMGRFNKDLVNKKFFAAIRTVEYNARSYLYAQTVPWGDDESRLLSVRRHMDFATKLQEFGAAFDVEAQAIQSNWPAIMSEAQQRLDKLFDPTQYPAPNALSSRFAFRVAYRPVPTGGDLRVDVDAAMLKEMRARIDEDSRAALAETKGEIWQRLYDEVAHMADVLSRDKTRIHESLVQNLVRQCDILPDLNFTDDPRLTKAIALVKAKLVVPVSRLRDDEGLKNDTALAAKKVAAAMKGWMNSA